ncbi:MAG: hypothetical protein ACE5IQ_02445 [Candidatus Methylomirabilales bacterium]
MKSVASSRGEKGRPVWDFPEARVLGPGFGLSLAWEVLQSPFYADTFEASWVTLGYNRLHCTAGDVLILLTAFWIVALIWGRSWMGAAGWVPLTLFVGIGFGYTLFSEHFNVHFVQSWAYSQWMPTIAGFGLVPLLQWMVIPPMIVQLARNRTGTAKLSLQQSKKRSRVHRAVERG